MKNSKNIRSLVALLMVIMLSVATITVRTHHHVEGADAVCVCLTPASHCHCSDAHHHSDDSEKCSLDLAFNAIHDQQHGSHCLCSHCHPLGFAVFTSAEPELTAPELILITFTPYRPHRPLRPALPGHSLRAPPCA